MCCSTGVCGPSVDPALARFAADLHWLANQRVAVERYNLAQQPQAFAAKRSRQVRPEAARERVSPADPARWVHVVSKGCYPSTGRIGELAGVEADFQTGDEKPAPSGMNLPVINTQCC